MVNLKGSRSRNILYALYSQQHWARISKPVSELIALLRLENHSKEFSTLQSPGRSAKSKTIWRCKKPASSGKMNQLVGQIMRSLQTPPFSLRLPNTPLLQEGFWTSPEQQKKLQQQEQRKKKRQKQRKQSETENMLEKTPEVLKEPILKDKKISYHILRCRKNQFHRSNTDKITTTTTTTTWKETFLETLTRLKILENLSASYIKAIALINHMSGILLNEIHTT